MARRGARIRPISFAPRLIVMAKSPLAGLVKRRLASGVGQAEAVRFYRACLSHTVMRLSGDARWQTLLAVTPDADLAAPFWPRVRTQTGKAADWPELGRDRRNAWREWHIRG